MQISLCCYFVPFFSSLLYVLLGKLFFLFYWYLSLLLPCFGSLVDYSMPLRFFSTAGPSRVRFLSDSGATIGAEGKLGAAMIVSGRKEPSGKWCCASLTKTNEERRREPNYRYVLDRLM